MEPRHKKRCVTPAEALRRSLQVPVKHSEGDSHAWLSVSAPQTLAQCAVDPTAVAKLRAAFANTSCTVVLVCGPPGSGKSVTTACAVRDFGGVPRVVDAVDDLGGACEAVRRGGQAVIVENSEAPGAASKLAGAARCRSAGGLPAVLIVQQRYGPAGRTLAGVAGSAVLFGPVPLPRAVYAAAAAAHALGASLSREQITRIARGCGGDLRAVLLRCAWEALGGSSTQLDDTQRAPRDAFEALAVVADRGASLEDGISALTDDRELHVAFLAHNRSSARLASSLSDDDYATFATPCAAQLVLAARDARRKPASQFPAAAAFGRLPTIGKARRTLQESVAEDVLHFFIGPLARSGASLTKAPRGAVPPDIAQAAARATRSTAARARAALHMATQERR